ncbi:MAG: FAD-dependent oxidoreductase, partial [Syntrophomonadaceae bacterium]|nr:FAD-dependent oxidoreductase [Syntrophomonadaceae bacterium]
CIHIPVITGGVIKSPELADRIIRENQADFVFLGRSLLADSDWAAKARQGRETEIRPCIMCNNCIAGNFKGLTVTCSVNPVTGRESQFNYYIDRSVNNKKQVLIAGSGPAGLEAALALDRQGFGVTLYEKGEKLGGLLNLAALPPYKDRVRLLRDYLLRQIEHSRVQVQLNQPFSPDILNKESVDYVIIATGSKLVTPSVQGWNSSFCLGLSDVLTRRTIIENRKVVIIGGGSNGCEVADFLLSYNNQICIVEKKDYLASDMEKKNRRDLMNRLEKGWVKKKTASRVLEVKPGTVRIGTNSGEEYWLEADYIVNAAGFIPDNELYLEIQALHPNVYLIGDAFEVGGFKQAFLQGAILAHRLNRV